MFICFKKNHMARRVAFYDFDYSNQNHIHRVPQYFINVGKSNFIDLIRFFSFVVVLSKKKAN